MSPVANYSQTCAVNAASIAVIRFTLYLFYSKLQTEIGVDTFIVLGAHAMV